MTRRLLALLCCLWLAPDDAAQAAPPALEDVKAAHPASESRLFDRHGVLLHEVRTDLSRRRGQWIAFSDISPRLRESVVALEDHRFFAHQGIDWLALAAAARDTLLGRTRGASTITMQVAAQLDPALRAPSRRSLRQKWRQLRAARALDARWRKQEILEAYLNLATFRGELQGVDSAARALFAKSATGIDAHEALLLALLLRSPNSTADAVAARGCRLAPLLPLAAAIDCRQLTRVAHAALGAPPGLRAAASVAPHAARRLLGSGSGNVTSTLAADVQHLALDSLQKQLRQLATRNVRDGAVLVVDNATGEVLAYVGNGGALSSAHHVDGVRALRQAGSTLKPFLYALAVEQKLLTAASLLEDSPVNLSTPTGLYVPQNYDHAFRGLVSLRVSLAGSLNVPAVRTLMLLGPDRLLERLRQLGFDDLDRDGDYYGYALALGSPEVSLWQLVDAYRSLARGGRRTPPLRLGPDDARAAASAAATPVQAGASFIIGDILADRDSRSRSFGVDNPLNLPFWAAVKTGTSKQMRDNWCIGYTPRYTVGVWVGNFDGAPMWEVSGLTGAAPVWAEVMRGLHAEAPAAPPSAPPGVERRPIDFERGLEASREEWFISGTAGDRPGPRRPAAAAPRIAYPGPDSVLVVDPDIPPAAQRVLWTMRPARDDLGWRLNGLALAGDSWQPRPGDYTLELVDGARRVLDVVNFTVRGAPAPDAASATGKGARVGGGNQPR